MGEAKQREARKTDKERALEETVRRSVDEGKLVEAGWQGMRLMAIDPQAPQVQLDEMRMAFFAGAQHLFGSIMQVLSPEGDEPTDEDMQRMDLIDKELKGFIQEFELKHGITKGSA